MNSLKYFLVSLLSVHSLTLNEKAFQRDLILESPVTKPLDHSQSAPTQSRKGDLNVEEALIQLRIALQGEKVDLTQDTTQLNALLENSTHVEADTIKSLIFSSVSDAARHESQAPSKTSSPLKTRDVAKASSLRKDFSKRKHNVKTDNIISAWAQSGGGCHSMVSQLSFALGFETEAKKLVRKIVKGARFTKETFKDDFGPAKYHTTSSGGSWMWVSYLGSQQSGKTAGRSLYRRNEIGWVDAIVIPKEDPKNWGKIIRHYIEGGKSSASLFRKGEKEMRTYEDMIRKSLGFYLQVREDPSLKNIDAQDIFQAELAAQVSKGSPEVQAMAAQYNVAGTSHPALLNAIKKAGKVSETPDLMLPYPDATTCDVSDPSYFATCDDASKLALFDAATVCVAKPAETETSSVWGWRDVNYKKFMKPWGLAADIEFGADSGGLVSVVADETWAMITTQNTGSMVPKATGSVEQVMTESSNVGLSLLYLVYYTKVVMGCGPNVPGALMYLAKTNVTSKVAEATMKSVTDSMEISKVYSWLSSATSISTMKSFYYFDYESSPSEFYFDGLSSDNVGLGPLLKQAQISMSLVSPSILVTSSGSDEFDFMAVAGYFMEYIPTKFAPPAAEVVVSMEYLCSAAEMSAMTVNPNYLLEGSVESTWVCLNAGDCFDDLFTYFGINAPPECIQNNGGDNVWSKLKKSGILYLKDLIVLANANFEIMSNFDVPGATFGLTVQNEMGFGWLQIAESMDPMMAADPYIDQFPTFPKGSLMGLPLKYAFLLSQYMDHVATVAMTCLLGGDDMGLPGYLMPCGSISCTDSAGMVFPIIP